MDEHEWLQSSDPIAMLELLNSRELASIKKRWLYEAHCYRLVPIHNADHEDLALAHESAGALVDARVFTQDWVDVRWGLKPGTPDPRPDILRCLFGNPFQPAFLDRNKPHCPRCGAERWDVFLLDVMVCLGCFEHFAWDWCKCPWLSWRDRTVPKLATAAAADVTEGRLDPSRLAILADALEEAGCQGGRAKVSVPDGHELCETCNATGWIDSNELPRPRNPGSGRATSGRRVVKYVAPVTHRRRCRNCRDGLRQKHRIELVYEPHPLVQHCREPQHWKGCWALDLLTRGSK